MVIDYGVFSQRLAERSDRWSLLVEFQREWGFVGAGNAWTPPPARAYVSADAAAAADTEFDPDDDYDYDDDGEAEYSWIPDAVTEWYALPQNSFSQAPRLYWTHPSYPPPRWPDSRTTRRLAARGVPAPDLPPSFGLFMGEYEACWIWGYREDEALVDPDPPVYVVNAERTVDMLAEDIESGEDAQMTVKVSRSVSEWALAFAAANLPFQISRLLDRPDELDPALVDRALVERHRQTSIGTLTAEQLERVRAGFPDLGLLPWWDFKGGSLLGGPDVLLILAEPREGWPDGDAALSIAARTPEALAAALAVIGIKPDGD